MPSDWEQSAEAWVQFVDSGDDNREFLLDEIVLRHLGDVQGQRVLDIGCGEGRFCRMLASKGATVAGIDPTSALIETAQQRDSSEYRVGSGTDLPYGDASFDAALLYLVLIDIKDYRRAIAEAARVLGPRGRLVIANLNGYATSIPHCWVKSESGEHEFVAMDNYMEERGDLMRWRGIEIINWHRPLQAYMQALLSAGLELAAFEEASPSDDQIRACPRIALHRRVPLFNVMTWTKK